jgi:hypothetical protein
LGLYWFAFFVLNMCNFFVKLSLSVYYQPKYVAAHSNFLKKNVVIFHKGCRKAFFFARFGGSILFWKFWVQTNIAIALRVPKNPKIAYHFWRSWSERPKKITKEVVQPP